MSQKFILLAFTVAILLHQSSSIPQAFKEEALNLEYHPDFANISTLKLVQVIFRHGDRTPIYTFPNDPNQDHNYGVKGLGQLTQVGKMRAYELGRYLRARYDGYLGKTYEIDEVFARSSSVLRTVTSGELCLAGLFPGEDNNSIIGSMKWQPIPILSISRKLDNKIGFYKPCLLHQELKNNFIKLQDSLETEKKKELLKLIQEKSGINKNLTIYNAVYQLADTFFVQMDNGLTVPEWTKGVFPELTSNLTDSEFTFDTGNHELRKLYIGPLVSELISKVHLKLGLSNLTAEELEVSPVVKMYLYSGHDTTISHLLNSFDLYDHEKPVYSAAVILELHKEPDAADHILKLFYKKHRNQEIVKLQIPNCPDPCSLNSFERNYKDFLFREQEWNDSCFGFTNKINSSE